MTNRHLLVVVAVVVMACTSSCGRDVEKGDPTVAFLGRAWESYKSHYIHRDGYVVDRTRGGGEVTSEGQGYALLRAVWMKDRDVFYRVWKWTEQTLQRPDGLFSWRWSPNTASLLDANTATDADQEIAFALLMAADVFGDGALREKARRVLTGIRRHAAIAHGGGWFPAAGNWAVRERVINLSYFIPYAYPAFERAEAGAGWESVRGIGYELLATASGASARQLVPDFNVLAEDGSLQPWRAGGEPQFSSDGMRIPWRIALDCQLHNHVPACADPLGVSRFTAMLARDGALFTRYSLSGEPLERVESFAFYGALLPYLQLFAPHSARALRSSRLQGDALEALQRDDRRYYDANWIWFGLAAADGKLSLH